MTPQKRTLITFGILFLIICIIALSYSVYAYGYARGQHDTLRNGETTRFHGFPNNPETDAEATALLLGDNPTASNYAVVGIYEIYRKRDGMTVIDAYIATLTHVIELQESE